MTGDNEERALLRASDADRAQVAQRLSAALDEGRLTLTDYDERLRDAYAAKTYSELDQLTVDLPAAAPDRLPVASTERQPATKAERAEWLDEWRSWAGGAVIMIAIWGVTSLVSGQAIPFWPAIPLGIWAAVLLASAITGDDKKKKQKKLGKDEKAELE